MTHHHSILKPLLLLTLLIFALPTMARRTLYVLRGEKINDALTQARYIYKETGEGTTIAIAPGDYEEQLTIDIPDLRLINTMSMNQSINLTEVRNGGTKIGPNTVRISWYYGHGYQYQSMGDSINWGGRRTRLWNASVLVDAPNFYAEGIVFQNSFNIYVSPAETRDELTSVCDRPEWTSKERPKQMPARPKRAYSTQVQHRAYGERASAISFSANAKNAELRRCRVVGRQDALFGDHGAELYIYKCILQGQVDYIFGGMTLTCKKSELVAEVTREKNDHCYIAAGRGAVRRMCRAEDLDSIPQNEFVRQGMLFENCTVRYANADEIFLPVDPNDPEQVAQHPIWLCRPWRWWGEHVFRNITAEPANILPDPMTNPERCVNLGLTKGHEAPYVRFEKR